jgi:hypothetical protein
MALYSLHGMGTVPDERRWTPDRRIPAAPDLHQRLEAKRLALDLERRQCDRRRNGSPLPRMAVPVASQRYRYPLTVPYGA